MTVISGTPAYIQVANDLRSQIRGGKLRPGDKLPSSAELRAKYAVSNTVIRDAVNELRRAGFVVGQQGKGVFVTSETPDSADTAPSELAVRVQALEARVSSLEEEDDQDQDLREQVADLQAIVIDLYARLGFPNPLKPSRGDAARTTDPVALSFPIPIKEALSQSRARDESGDLPQERPAREAGGTSASADQEPRDSEAPSPAR